MLHLEHINLVVTDLNASLSFYRAAFPHWQLRNEGQADWYGKPLRWLHFGDDYQYIALSDHGEGANRELTGHQVGLAHFAFAVSDLAALIERLDRAGFAIAKNGADEPWRRNVYYLDPDGFEVEFVQYLSDLPRQRNHSQEQTRETP